MAVSKFTPDNSDILKRNASAKREFNNNERPYRSCKFGDIFSGWAVLPDSFKRSFHQALESTQAIFNLDFCWSRQGSSRHCIVFNNNVEAKEITLSLFLAVVIETFLFGMFPLENKSTSSLAMSKGLIP
jgi:hypothetical protein